MSFRNTSGKFSLSSFGRRQPSGSGPESPGATGGGGGGHFSQSQTNNHEDRDEFNPRHDGTGGGSGSGSGPGLGWKLGKSIAHQSLLPALGNQDLRALQGVISSEKGVLNHTERLAQDTQKAASALPLFGAEEGPDLQDILTHSSTLLSHLSAALTVFGTHQSNMRICYKKIREREEELDELRRRRRATGAKAESAEKKLAKMGPENKGLGAQTELLEKLRVDMRQMDTDIVLDESKLGDYKRQVVKEALSLKFGGLEELGEKMCIIGELGKLLLEEIPLEETPPGYGRAPYTGYDKTENAVNEATRCLSTVTFNAASSNPRPPGLPHHTSLQPLTAPNLPRQERVVAAEEFANFPGNVASPEAKGKGREGGHQDYSLDQNPYGGFVDHGDKYRDFGGMRGEPYASGNGQQNGNSHVVWQGPTEDALRAHQDLANSSAPLTPGANGTDRVYDYEYEQQKQLDAEEAAWREAQSAKVGADGTYQVNGNGAAETQHGTQLAEAEPRRSWEPLNVKRERSDRGASPDPNTAAHSQGNAAFAAPVVVQPQQDMADTDELTAPNPAFLSQGSGGHARAHTPQEGYYTPMETPPNQTNPLDSLEKLAAMEKTYSLDSPESTIPPPPPPPQIHTALTGSASGRNSPALGEATPTSPVGTYSGAPGAKMSAAAFRKAAKPRNSSTGPSSADPEDDGQGNLTRRLPVPPVGSGFGYGQSPYGANGKAQEAEQENKREASPPPSYGGHGSAPQQNEESLR